MSWLRAPGADDDKRSMGVLGVITGSERYPGAAVLGVEAAWRTGIGTVRLWAPRRVQDLVLARRPETVCHGMEEAPADVDGWVLGSGQDARDRDPLLRSLLVEVLGSGAPCIADAGALDLARGHAGPLAVTPHARELARLRMALGLGDRGARETEGATAAAQVARSLDAVVVAKGSTTLVVDVDGSSTSIEPRTHRLATAGTGDVLAGVLGAVLAANASASVDAGALASIAIEGVRLHGAAGAMASADGRPITALDVARLLPETVAARAAR